jgi:ComF family protein
LLCAISLDDSAGAFIHAMKYLSVQSLAAPLTDRACDLLALRHDTASLFGACPLIVPVPLHASRLRERGYNQAELIARRVAVITAMPICATALSRIRPTGQQVKTSGRSERRENMRGAFVVTDGVAVVDRDIVLVDDVTTTGATLEDCARALKEAGASSVSAITLAHG